MVVKNKEKTINKANEVSDDLMEKLFKEITAFDGEDDPAEYIYLIAHTLAMFSVKISQILSAYTSIYGIDKLTKEKFYEWVNIIINENMRLIK